MPLTYETLGKGDKSRFHRLVARIPIGTQVCALGSLLLIAGFIAGPTWASSSGPRENLLVNPSYKVAGSNRANVEECSGTPSCAPSESAAARWNPIDLHRRVPVLGATTPRVASTLGHGARSMLHVTGDAGAGIDQAGTLPATAARRSVLLLPVVGKVKACVGRVPRVARVGHDAKEALTCTPTPGLRDAISP
jgi:hypothetical protein